MNNAPFIGINTESRFSARCVDGRKDIEDIKELGPQMLGGSILPVLIKAIANNEIFDEKFLRENLRILKTAGFGLGVHTDDHHECGCGLAANLELIVKVAHEQKDLKYAPEKIAIKGVELLKAAVSEGAEMSVLSGNHGEVKCFVNTKENTTFDTALANERGYQAFNLDLWAAVEQAGALGVDAQTAKGLALILYAATEIVLVEMKGKEALPVETV